MQSTVNPVGSRVQYSHVNITADSIPIWGHCHRRIGNNVILMDSSGGANCIRCFHLRLRSRNVLQVHTEGLEKCYTNEDAALTTCPDEGALDQQGHSKEILLYKTQDFGSRGIHQEYCPINGRFTYVYNVNDGLENNVECPDPVSELDNCPSGSELNLRFRGCSFDNHDITFRCLGDWHGSGNQRYLALLDTRMGDHHPQYRCAVYREEPGTGNIFIAFSSDSTCHSGLVSATVGYETLSLTTLPAAVWPEMVDTSSCRFPSWTQGHWQYLYVEGNTLIYKDHHTFKTYTMRCLGSDSGAGERFLVFGRTQCGEEMYTCMWIKRRGMNVLEFQIGLQSSTYYNSSLCSNTNFQLNQWITQGRMERLQESPCPVAGEYAGYIPDATGLCAKLSSDCKSPEIMYYTVSDCSHNEIYEASINLVGSRRHGRKHRQIGTRVFRISDPRTTSSPSLFSHSTTSLSHLSHVTVTNHRTASHNNFNDSYKTDIYTNYNNNRNPYQISERKEHSTSGYFLGGHSSPQYPTAYRNLERPNSRSTPQTNDYSDEVYDPWAFSKTHNQSPGEHVNPNMPSNRNFPRPPYSYDQTQPGGGYYTKSATPIEQINYYGTPLDATPDQITRNTFRNQMGNPERQFQNSGYPNTVIRQGDDQHDSPGTGRNVHTNQFSSSNHNSDPRNPNIHSPKREYRCLGQWEENGRMFTYTQRRDVGSFECFVGSILSDTEIFIKEAGDHCQRDVDPMQHGMKLTRLGRCVAVIFVSAVLLVTGVGQVLKKRHHLINASQYHLTLSTPSHKQDNVSPRATAATSRARTHAIV
uniref:Uncharacterized protein n=1 Tax=Timema shepardi TaxID=629360 RepID=A0A7R9AXL8_TIMSH|nr:unnamed protein product [Timema shepardi]